MSFFAATAVVLSATPSFAATSIELTDKRSENQNGLQLIYEVRAPRPSRARRNRIQMGFCRFCPCWDDPVELLMMLDSFAEPLSMCGTDGVCHVLFHTAGS